ncbi:CsbD family protein [Luteipulveratus mongoliensis]|uniref:CsbD family protein n=1 Tax=Luteipulveratus mongoliensis TaxID=571913 RepID=UPI0009FA3379|nr:CsbD family protein [Luteipulveratus mongoliensis]
MGIADKAKHAAEDALGKAKEATGKAGDDEDLQAEGQKDQVEAKIKKTGDDIKDVFDK